MTKVGDDSEAEGKLLPGDLVTAVNGQALGSGASLQSALAEQFVQESLNPDTDPTLTLFLTLTLTLTRILFTLMPTHLAFPTPTPTPNPSPNP